MKGLHQIKITITITITIYISIEIFHIADMVYTVMLTLHTLVRYNFKPMYQSLATNAIEQLTPFTVIHAYIPTRYAN